MNNRIWVTAVAAAALLILLGGGVAKAASLTAFAGLGGLSADPNVFYTPGGGGGLTVQSASEFLQGKLGQGFDVNATASFAQMVNGSFLLNGNGSFDQSLNPGADTSSFVITDNTTHKVLLSGIFGRADLTGVNGASSGNVTLASDNVTYTGGTFFPAGYSPTNGSLSIEFTSTDPFSATSSGLAGFSAVDGVTFSASKLAAVPEPASTASLGVGALFLLGALFRKRRQSRVLASAV